MSVQIIPDVQTYSSYTARYSGNTSQQDNYPFINCTAYRDKMWLEWRSGYPSSLTHDITISHDLGTATGLALIGCNFQTITVSSQTRALMYSKATGDYRGMFQVSLPSGTAFQIPSQTTVEGYFRCKAIILGTFSSYDYLRVRYPFTTEIAQTRIEESNLSGQSRVTKGGERRTLFVLDCQPTYTSSPTTFNNYRTLISSAMPMQYTIALNFTRLSGETRYCRRIDESELTEVACRQYKMPLVFKEL